MNNINIKNIFYEENINNSEVFNLKIFNTYDLVAPVNRKSDVSDNKLVEKIKTNAKLDEYKIDELYDKIYNECLLKINNAIDNGITDIYFSLSNIYFGYKLYNSKICLKSIQKKLRDKNFETFIYSNNDIFISWKHFT
jgi:hypothetical protein